MRAHWCSSGIYLRGLVHDFNYTADAPMYNNLMTDPEAILQRIIDDNGDCDSWATPETCKNCPLGNKQLDGKKVNCLDYLGINLFRHAGQDAAALYKRAAEDELFNLKFNGILE